MRDAARLVRRVKHFPLRLRGPRPIEEAISSAGGIAWSELNDDLMLTKLPGVFVAGEMIDWEAPTGGYLLQGCLSTGTRAGRAAAQFAGDIGDATASQGAGSPRIQTRMMGSPGGCCNWTTSVTLMRWPGAITPTICARRQIFVSGT